MGRFLGLQARTPLVENRARKASLILKRTSFNWKRSSSSKRMFSALFKVPMKS
jgi:hypothetical protein